MAIVTIKDVTVRYGKNVVIDKLSLQVERGENLAIVGPSSCGKTTLMRALCGFIKISEGEITLQDTVVSNAAKRVLVPPEKRDIGVVFQDYAVWPHLTVIENIMYPLKKRRVPKEEMRTRAYAALSQVKMKEFAERLPSQLSGGQQQRVALARALVSSSDLIVLDEPITNLDAKLREEMAYEIRNLQQTMGVTVIYITHDQETAMTISDRMVIMDRKGTIRQIGTPEEIWNHPHDQDVYKFIGVSNFLPVHRKGDTLSLVTTGIPQSLSLGTLSVDLTTSDRMLLASRPMDIRLIPLVDEDAPGLIGEVERVTYLGNQFDYIVDVSGHKLRVQQDSLDAFREGVPMEGRRCGLVFRNPTLYPAL